MTSLPPPLHSYNKPWRSYPDQIALLHARGLVIRDVSSATAFLRHVNYYRFSGYCLAFELARHAFRPGTTFEQVKAAYDFDRVLRDVVTEGLEAVEVDLRTTVAYHFGGRYGAFGHSDARNFFNYFNHADWLDKLHGEADRSSEMFVTHFRGTYREYPDLPIWVITEIMSFGALSKMYQGMLKKDQKPIANNYGLQPDVLQSWMHHLTYVRNLCAHHSRLWDRVWSVKPHPAYGHAWRPPCLPSNNRLFITLLILNWLMRRCPSVEAFAADWRSRVEMSLSRLPAVPNAADLLGLTWKWKSHLLWNPSIQTC